MSICDQEMCENWTGHGCACEVFGIDRREDWDCGSGMCDPNTGCPACEERDHWARRA